MGRTTVIAPARAPGDLANISDLDLPSLMRVGLDGGRLGAIRFYDRPSRSFETVSYPELYARSFALSRQFAESGVAEGDPVIVWCSSPQATILGFLAAIAAGALPLIARAQPGPGRTVEAEARISALARSLGPRAALLAQRSALPTPITRPVTRSITFDVADLLDHDSREQSRPVTTRDLALPLYLQMTSGTTNGQRIAAVTNEGVIANCRALAQPGAFPVGASVTSWLPLNHDLGLVGVVMLCMLADLSLSLMTPFDFLAEPGLWLRTVSETKSVWSVAPNFGYEHATRSIPDAMLDELDLSHWTFAGCGGEPVIPSTLDRFARRFGRCGFAPAALSPGYGLAEMTMLCAASDHRRPARILAITRHQIATSRPVDIVDSFDVTRRPASSIDPTLLEVISNGQPVPGTTISLRDPETGAPIEREDIYGELVFSGDSMTAGYWQADGTIALHDDGIVYSGDLGFIHDGELYIVDRLKNVIIRNGQNYPASVIERALADATGLSAGRFAVVDRDIHDPLSPVFAVIELERGTTAEALAERIAAAAVELALPVSVLAFVARGAIPTTSSGKKRHGELRRMLRDGELVIKHETVLLPKAADTDDTTRVITANGTTNGSANGTANAATEPTIDLRDTATQDQTAAIVLAAVRKVAETRGTAARVAQSAHVVADLDLDSLALYEIGIALEERLGVALDDEALLAVRHVRDLVDVARVSSVNESSSDSSTGLASQTEALFTSIPQVATVATEQRRRQVLIDGKWCTDFASCNYLGLDLHPEVHAAIGPMIDRWGVHPSWTRAVASPAPYRELEERLAVTIGAADTLVFPTVTLLHLGVLPALSARGTLIIDSAAHHSIHEAADVARARGVRVLATPHDDLNAIDRALARAGSGPRVVALDGIYSMSGRAHDLRAYIEVAARHDAKLYVDDAHGFGVIGARPDDELPYGYGGGGLVCHQGVDYEHVLYVGGLSKAFSTMAAFISVPDDATRRQLQMVSSLVFSGPIPVASLASGLAGLAVNDREGDALRRTLYGLTTRLASGIRELGLEVSNESSFPIINVTVGRPQQVIEACQVLWEHGMLITPAVFPAVPLHRGGMRFSITAANTEAEIDAALAALEDVVRRVETIQSEPATRRTVA